MAPAAQAMTAGYAVLCGAYYLVHGLKDSLAYEDKQARPPAFAPSNP